MRNIFYALAIVLVIFSCQEKAPIDYIVLSGKIQNNTAKELVFATNLGVPQDTLAITNDGNFSNTLKVEAGRYMLFDGMNRIPLYLKTADNINIDFDAKDYNNTLVYSGVGSERNNYIISKSKKEKELSGEGNKIYLLDEDAYKSKNQEIKTALEGMITSAEGISESFKSKEKRNINYEYFAKLNKYEKFHAYHAKKQDFKISGGFLNELDNIDYNNEEDFIFSSSYKNIVTAHYNKKASELAKSDTRIKEDVAFFKVVGDIPNEMIKNSLLISKAKFGITITENLDTYYNSFMSASTNDENNKVITESYDKLKVLDAGQPSPKFVNYKNFAGETTSLNDLLGKYVYIDVWATWCAPCKAEIPFLKEIEKQYHDKNIEFVSISVDKPAHYDKWIKMVNDKELSGVQLMADNAFSSEFIKNYMIQGIPRFILIDPQGNIVTANAPRPSHEELKTLFNELKI